MYHHNCTKGQKFISELSTNAPALDKKLTVRTVRLRSPFTFSAGIVWGMVGDRDQKGKGFQAPCAVSMKILSEM